MIPVDIALVLAAASYNREDFSPLEAEPGVILREVRFPTQLGNPDVVILPGTPDVAADFDTLAACGMADAIKTHELRGGWVVGICGGMHMMAQRLTDPQHVKYSFSEKQMLGLLALEVHYGGEQVFRRLRHVSAPGRCELRGFETHRGQCEGAEPVLFRREDGSPIGYGHGRCWGTYLHRLFDSAAFRRHFLAAVRAQAPDFSTFLPN